MPLNEEYLETSQVIRLTQHFMAKKAQEGHFVSYETYIQSPLEGKSFGGSSPSSVIAMAKRPGEQLPVLFACDGQPDDEKRKEAPWKFSEIVLKAMSEWVRSPSQQKSKAPSSEQGGLRHLDFDFHLALRKGNHWTVYVFKFRGVQQAVLKELADLEKKHSETEMPREAQVVGNGCDFFEAKTVPNAKYISELKKSAYVLVGDRLFHIDKCKPSSKPITPYEIKGIKSENLSTIKNEFKLPISGLSLEQMQRIQELTKHLHGEGRVKAQEYRRQEQEQIQEVHQVLARLYQSVTVSYIDSKRWAVPQTIQADLRAVFGPRLPIITRLQCAYQPDGYSCGDRVARNTVAAATGDSLEEALDTYDVRLETMAILGIPLVQEVSFFTGYILLRCVAVLIVCFVLNYFLAANTLAAIGGLGGLLGIGLVAWALFEMARWLMQPETKPGEAAAYERFKPKAVSRSDKPVPSGSLLASTAALSPPVSKSGTFPSPQPSPAPTTKDEST